MRAFANILRHYNHPHHEQQQQQSSSSKDKQDNLLMISDVYSSSMGSMNSDPLCCPLARSHDDLLLSTSPLGSIRPDLLPGQINDIDEIKSNHSL